MKGKAKVMKMEWNSEERKKEKEKEYFLNGSNTRLYQELSVSRAEITESV
jgi:hypothetical protein